MGATLGPTIEGPLKICAILKPMSTTPTCLTQQERRLLMFQVPSCLKSEIKSPECPVGPMPGRYTIYNMILQYLSHTLVTLGPVDCRFLSCFSNRNNSPLFALKRVVGLQEIRSLKQFIEFIE